MDIKDKTSHTINSSEGKRIGLITPYQGFNFGDGAIQDTMLTNLKSIDPSVQCFGITLYPVDTVKRHGIPSIPITGLIVRDYSEAELLFARELLPQHGGVDNRQPEYSVNGTRDNTGSRELHFMDRLRGIKNIPLLGKMLRSLVFRLRDIRKLIVELREILYAYRFARSIDLLVLSGGGQLDEAHGGPWGHPYVMFRWAMIGRLTRTPYAIVSTGSAKLESGLTCWFVKQALRLAVYRSYRDMGTRNQLGFLRFTQSDPIVRDLALGLDPSTYPLFHNNSESQRIIAVSPIYYNDPLYTTYADFVDGISDFIRWLVKRGDRVLLFRTTSIERLVLSDIWKNLNMRFGDDIYDHVEEVEAACYQELMKKIAVVDLVVASRLHSIILSHVLRKPTLAISWDRKVEAHMEDMEQTQYMIDIHSLSSNNLKSAFEDMESNADNVRSILHKRINSFQPDIKRQYEILLELAST